MKETFDLFLGIVLVSLICNQEEDGGIRHLELHVEGLWTRAMANGQMVSHQVIVVLQIPFVFIEFLSVFLNDMVIKIRISEAGHHLISNQIRRHALKVLMDL